MSNVTHTHERADRAAREVDPLMLAQALDHIARTARLSRSQTRRIRWIEQRALFALDGREYRDIDIDLPKVAGELSQERLRQDRAHLRSERARLIDALRELWSASCGVTGAEISARLRARTLLDELEPADPLAGWRSIDTSVEADPAPLEVGDNAGVPSFTELSARGPE